MKAFASKSETPPASPRRWPKFLTTDRLLALSGFALAGMAAFFPWYVFVNQGSFGVRDSGLRLEGHGRGTPSAHRTAGLLAPEPDAGLAAEFDPISTAAIPDLMPRPKRDEAAAAEAQPFPGRTFELLHVANGQALISDASGIYLVRVGSRLPDESTLVGIEKRDAEWVIETSNGDVIGH